MRTNPLKFFGARRRMNVFRVCRQGLTVLTVVFMFMACDQLPTTGGSGVDIPVKIRAVSIAGGAQNETVTRASGGEKRIIGEPIIQDLGGGMLAEITVEEEVSALRAAIQLGSGSAVKFRVIAVNSSDNKVYSYADYTAGSGAIIRDNDTPELHVVSGGSYYFVCISHNNSTLPPAPNEGDDLSTETVEVTAGSNDLLYQTFTPTGTIPATGLDLSFTDLTHKLARVELVLDGNGKTITSVDNSKISLDAANTGSFNLKEGKFSSSSGNTDFTGWSSFGEQTVTSEAVTFIPRATGDYILSFASGAVTRMDGTTPLTSTGAWTATILNSKFVAGRSYTIKAKLYKKIADKFAVSNIYWDGDKLTFEPHGGANITYAKYQGVYFKWGSLIGIAAGANGETYSASSTILYKPTNTSASVGTARTWKTTTGTSTDHPAWSDWDAIPSHYDTSMSEDETLFSKGATGFTGFKGDICFYIDQNYRMPTRLELDNLKSYHQDYTAAAITVSKADGTYMVTTQYATLAGRIFPASGYRFSGSGALGTVGSNGYHWTGSAIDGTTHAHEFRFYSSSGSAGADPSPRRSGQPVRCVLNE